MSIRCDGCGLEYAGAKGLGGLFAQPRSLARPAYLRMLLEVKRFHRHARRVLAAGDDDRDARPVPVRRRVLGVLRPALHGPARLVRLVDGARGGTGLPRSLPVRLPGQPRDAVGHRIAAVANRRRGIAQLRREGRQGLTSVRLATPVRSIRPDAPRVSRSVDGDGVRRAGSTRSSSRPTPTPPCRCSPTRLPANARCSARSATPATTRCCTPTSRCCPSADRARAVLELPDAAVRRRRRPTSSVSYDMNRLQQLPTATPYVVSLNAGDAVDPTTASSSGWTYEHPIYDLAAVAAQRRLPELADGRTAFAGAYHGWGFHEDGCRSGVEAARSSTGSRRGDRQRRRTTRSSHARTRRRSATGSATAAGRGWSTSTQVPRLPRGLRWLARFDARDHLGDPARVAAGQRRRPFSPTPASTCAAAGSLMLANARALGHVFNPISIHWCYAADGGLARSSPRCTTPTATGTRTCSAPSRTAAVTEYVDKQMYVSPFNPVDGRYRIAVSAARRASLRRLSPSSAMGSRRSSPRCKATRAAARRPLLADAVATAAGVVARQRPDPLAGGAAVPPRPARRTSSVHPPQEAVS